MQKKSQGKQFELKIKRLKEIVAILDSRESSLDEMLEIYEEASKLAVECREFLDGAEQKVKEIGDKYFNEQSN